MKTYPIGLIKLEGCRSIVVGGGKVALRKTTGLLEAGASVTIISPEIVSDLNKYYLRDEIEWHKRGYEEGDLDGAFLVVAATDSCDVNHAVWQDAVKSSCLINVVDDPEHSNFILPAIIRRGDVTISISTGGTSPALARRLKENLEKTIDPDIDMFSVLLGEMRKIIFGGFSSAESRRDASYKLVDSNLFEVLKRQGYDYAKQKALEIIGVDIEDG